MDLTRRQLVEWRFGKGMEWGEIAGHAGKSEGAVKMLINRSIKELRDAMGEDFGNPEFRA